MTVDDLSTLELKNSPFNTKLEIGNWYEITNTKSLFEICNNLVLSDPLSHVIIRVTFD